MVVEPLEEDPLDVEPDDDLPTEDDDEDLVLLPTLLLLGVE